VEVKHRDSIIISLMHDCSSTEYQTQTGQVKGPVL